MRKAELADDRLAEWPRIGEEMEAKAWEEPDVPLALRARKDLQLCKRARDRSRRFYGRQKSTLAQVRRWDGLAPWQNARIFHGGKHRLVRFKEMNQVYWEGGAKKLPAAGRVAMLRPDPQPPTTSRCPNGGPGPNGPPARTCATCYASN